MTDSTHNLTITEMTVTYGVTKRLLRFYEQMGLLRPLRHGTRRVYRPADQADLRLILAATKHGLTLKEIKAHFTPGQKQIAVPAKVLADRATLLEAQSERAVEVAATIRATLGPHVGDTVQIGAL